MAVNTREPLSKVDTAWLRMDSPTNLMQVVSVLLFDEPVDIHRLRRLIEDRLLHVERFRQRVVIHARDAWQPFWELDPTFDLDAHLHRLALPRPGGDAELREVVGDLMSTPLDHAKPLWQLHVVEGYGSGTAVVTRIHHCVADGIALVALLLSLTDADSEGAHPLGPPWYRASASTARRHSGTIATGMRLAMAGLREAADSAVHPLHAYRIARTGARGLAAFVRVSTLPTEPRTAIRGSLGVRKYPTWSDPIAISDVKAVAQLVRGTVNDVLVTVAAGAVRRYLAARGDDVDHISVHATVPVNLRDPEDTLTLGNRFGLVYPALPVDIADPVRRLHVVKERMDALKQSPEAGVAIGVLDLLGRMPAAVEHAAIELFTSKSSMVLTNVPGPRDLLYLAGVPLRRILVWAPPSGSLSMSFSILSYAGAVTVGIAADTGVVPDPEQIVAAFHDELHALAEAGRRIAEKRVRARRPI